MIKIKKRNILLITLLCLIFGSSIFALFVNVSNAQPTENTYASDTVRFTNTDFSDTSVDNTWETIHSVGLDYGITGFRLKTSIAVYYTSGTDYQFRVLHNDDVIYNSASYDTEASYVAREWDISTGGITGDIDLQILTSGFGQRVFSEYLKVCFDIIYEEEEEEEDDYIGYGDVPSAPQYDINYEPGISYNNSDVFTFNDLNNTDTGYYPATYDFNDEEAGNYTSNPTDLDFVDSATLYDGSLAIVESFGRKNVLRLQDDASEGEDPYIRHNITQTNNGIIELYFGGSDVSALNSPIQLTEGGAVRFAVGIQSGDLKYWDGGSWYTILSASDNTWYHIKIQWYADDTFDVYVNGVLEVDGVSMDTGQTAGIGNIRIRQYNDATDYVYLDAYGDPDNDSDYSEGDNLTPVQMSNSSFIDESNIDYSNYDLNFTGTEISDTVRFSNNSEEALTTTNFEEIKRIEIDTDYEINEYKVKWSIAGDLVSLIESQVYLNGSAIGYIHSESDPGYYTYYDEYELFDSNPLNEDDILAIYVRDIYGAELRVKDFRISYSKVTELNVHEQDLYINDTLAIIDNNENKSISVNHTLDIQNYDEVSFLARSNNVSNTDWKVNFFDGGALIDSEVLYLTNSNVAFNYSDIEFDTIEFVCANESGESILYLDQFYETEGEALWYLARYSDNQYFDNIKIKSANYTYNNVDNNTYFEKQSNRLYFNLIGNNSATATAMLSIDFNNLMRTEFHNFEFRAVINNLDNFSVKVRIHYKFDQSYKDFKLTQEDSKLYYNVLPELRVVERIDIIVVADSLHELQCVGFVEDISFVYVGGKQLYYSTIEILNMIIPLIVILAPTLGLVLAFEGREYAHITRNIDKGELFLGFLSIMLIITYIIQLIPAWLFILSLFGVVVMWIDKIFKKKGKITF